MPAILHPHVVVPQIASVRKADLGNRIGRLDGARVDRILAGLRFQQRSFGRAPAQE